MSIGDGVIWPPGTDCKVIKGDQEMTAEECYGSICMEIGKGGSAKQIPIIQAYGQQEYRRGVEAMRDAMPDDLWWYSDDKQRVLTPKKIADKLIAELGEK